MGQPDRDGFRRVGRGRVRHIDHDEHAGRDRDGRPARRRRRRAQERGLTPVGRPILAGFLLALILATPASASAQPDILPLPPREFSAVDTFLDAIALEDEATLIIDTFWQPAIAALVAANRDRPEQARAFASEQ